MSRGAWDGYWGKGASGCLPDADPRFGRALETLWRDFASRLPRGAKLLDLATGSGAVLRAIAAGGAKLDLTGVDSARTLPPAPGGIRLKAAVSMERLPFADARFDALTSQFGIEYGDVGAAAAEGARVLKPGAAVRLVVHRAEGPIVAHNLARRAALHWARHESGALDRARKLAEARRTARLATPPSFRAAPDEALRRFNGQAAAEFMAAILQTLDMGIAHPPAETLDVLAELERRADGEIGRLDALAAAARDEGAIRALSATLHGAGLAMRDPEPVAAGGDAFAWLLDGIRV
ncbi:MAG: methyltransferase domain-containing protein [Sphingomonas sp.]|nr:methyltransferase domain-containing protein [Sphingomonas sp.]